MRVHFWIVGGFSQHLEEEQKGTLQFSAIDAAQVINWTTKPERIHHVTEHLRSLVMETFESSPRAICFFNDVIKT